MKFDRRCHWAPTVNVMIGLLVARKKSGVTSAVLVSGAEVSRNIRQATDRRATVIKSGLAHHSKMRDMPLAKVETLLSGIRSLFGKLLGYGTLVFKGSGGTRRDV